MRERQLFNGWKRLCLLLGLCVLPLGGLAQDNRSRELGRDGGGKRIALVIGNDAYQKVDTLKNARNDARLMAATLTNAGFEVTQVNDLGRDAMWRNIDTFKSRINKGDEVVFYFAGHGVQINSNQLLLPVDITAVNDGQVQRDAVSLVDVQDALKDARFAFLVIDACRDNPFPKTGTRSIGGNTRGLLPPEPVTGQIIVMSAGRNQKALDSVPGETIANGLFTWELTQALQTPGIEIRAALERVKDRVDDRAKSVGHEQRPGMVSDLRGSFYFFGNTNLHAQGGIASADAETAFWNQVRSSGSREYLDAYFKEYPGGRYLALAKIELKKIDDKDQAERDRQVARLNEGERTAWNNAQRAATQAAYASFLATYPSSPYAALARAAQVTLQREVTAQQPVAAAPPQREQPDTDQREETEVWRKAETATDLAAVQAYLKKYPAGSYAVQALARVAQFKVEEAKEPKPGAVFKDCAECADMVTLPAGSFEMGDSGSTHNVALKAFAMGKTEVTQRQWQAVMGGNPGVFRFCGGECPVENVREALNK